MSEALMTMNRHFISRLHWRAVLMCDPGAVGFAGAGLTARPEGRAKVRPLEKGRELTRKRKAGQYFENDHIEHKEVST